MAGMSRDRGPSRAGAVTAVASELSQWGWEAAPASEETPGIDLYALHPDTNRRLRLRVLGNPRFDRRGRPEWLVGAWRFQSRPRIEHGLPFFRHPYYPGFWVLRDFPTECDLCIFLYPQEGQEARPRYFVCPADHMRQSLSETPTWAENYHGVRDRPCWVGLEAIGVFEERWDQLEAMGRQ